MRYRDRREAGRKLAAALARWRGRDDLIVLGLPRGGVIVAAEIARALRAPLDVLVVRKLGVPGHEELAMGAIASGGVQVLDKAILSLVGADRNTVAWVVAREQAELARREQAYRGDRPPADVEGRVVILVDDGLATGSTMRAAIQALRSRRPAQIVVAVPVCADTSALAGAADEIVCPLRPEPFVAVGFWYDDFHDTPDDEVRALLEQQGLGDEPEQAPTPAG